MNVSTLRAHFPYFSKGQRSVYLDNAATTQKPQQVIDAIADFYAFNSAPIARSLYDHAELTTELYEKARITIASWIKADPDEIIFTSGATAGINLAACAWGATAIGGGDHIAVSQLEHHSNLIPWMELAKKNNAYIAQIPVGLDGTLQLELLDDVISKKTKLIAITHVSNVTGATTDLEPILIKAKQVGARVLLDASQSVPHQLIDVKSLDIDFLVFSGHKMLGPTGIGVLYVKKELHNDLIPYQYGGGMIAGMQDNTYRLCDTPQRFEAGTPPIAQAIGLAAAIDYLQNINFDIFRRHEAKLCSLLIDAIDGINNITVIGPRDMLVKKGHIVSFAVNDIHPHDVAAFLNYHGICVRAGNLCAAAAVEALGYGALVRASFYCYNSQEDVNRLISALKQLPKL